MEYFSDYMYAIIVFVLGLILIFTNAYFKTKGSNQAHKEDTEEITTIIKEVEHNFNQSLEIVKSKLDNTNSILKELNNNEKEIILSIFNKTFIYYSSLVNLTFGNIDTEDNNDINKEIALESNKFDDLYISYQILKVFIPENSLDIIYKHNDCMDEFIKFREKRLSHLHLLKSLNIDYKINTKNPHDGYYKKIEEINLLYSNNVGEFIEVASRLLNDYTDEVRKYVKSKLLS